MKVVTSQAPDCLVGDELAVREREGLQAGAVGGQLGDGGVRDEDTLLQVLARVDIKIIFSYHPIIITICSSLWQDLARAMKPASVRRLRPAHSRVTRSGQWEAAQTSACTNHSSVL